MLAALFLLFLLAVGFSILQAIAHRHSTLREVLGLPKRPTSVREWTLGAAVGWGCVVLAVLPMTLTGKLDVQLWMQPRAIWLLLLNLLTLGIAALAEEVAFRGYPFRRLIEAIGPVAATIGMSILFGLGHALNPGATWTGVFVTMLAGLLFSVAWLRTHGLWLSWGLHFAWNASIGVLFGLPISGISDFASVVQTRAFGPLWLTGGSYGPEGAAFTVVVLLIGVGVLIPITRDYAWNYTHKPIVAGGYAIEVQPPPAHVAMEQEAKSAPASSLVQILPVTPQTRSVGEEPKL
ncbi:CPBP family intramembrane glutamic endopeptidase [Tunturiibacter gelidoferens]|uniref:CPBP family intramembrane metalloprotease n=1 Tax=Tunturiibacter gelidiferens TaxID=3069689 RepID=A0AAU7YX18_9BACT